jgi:hypothetical protein
MIFTPGAVCSPRVLQSELVPFRAFPFRGLLKYFRFGRRPKSLPAASAVSCVGPLTMRDTVMYGIPTQYF